MRPATSELADVLARIGARLRDAEKDAADLRRNLRAADEHIKRLEREVERWRTEAQTWQLAGVSALGCVAEEIHGIEQGRQES